MSSAKSGQEVVQRFLIGEVHDGEPQAPFVAVAAEDVVVTHSHVEEIARRDARRVLVVVFGPGGGNGDAGSTLR